MTAGIVKAGTYDVKVTRNVNITGLEKDIEAVKESYHAEKDSDNQ